MQQLVLASTSSYRRALLQRLGLAFDTANPQVDETEAAGEAPAATAKRLAEAKARAVASRYPDALIIGSDQVAALGDLRLNKPLVHDVAVRQLQAARGKAVSFHTALCLLHAASGEAQTRLVSSVVHFREYSDAQIERYLRREQPYDCAGSAKAEGLGIAMIARLEGDDPTALIGLPLIALTEMLAARGVAVI
ncbi:MAG: Maf family nucleotide pyrophosphatase [Betaproteobacteria bacterium]|nr:Maf family nucleotide pyrophosphatase [Pseudomonadota bacterium]